MSKQLEELGYTRKVCNTCGETFWSIDDRATCGDAPCDEYSFIGNSPTSKKYDLYEIQKVFRDFFKKEGHEPIDRYPVLAKRWRDDVFLVGASIFDFQPWVSSGLVEPPANPLTIAQPSIRLNDVDNVGRTGRHMTCFTMGAHHAFNTEKNPVYWKDETVKYCHDFIASIGIDPSEITYIESWWKGGGNEGPCFEICVRGVELATLVFIQYESLPDGSRREIPLKIVDTGYGLERFAWISQGSPTAYDASFGPVIDKLKKTTDVSVDEKILAENAQVAGMMDIETYADIRSLRSKVANRLDISLEDLLESTLPMEAIYIIADHTRCLSFMLSDGIIPSNVKEGYLARLVLRRTIRFMNELNMNESLVDVMKIQSDFLSKTYPEIKKSRDYLMNIIELEEERYGKTISKGKQTVKKTVKNLKKKDKTEMPLESLISLYDAHGMPPETVKEISESIGFKTNIPDNFFTLVANEHEQEEHEEKPKHDIDFPETELLFYNDVNLFKSEAKLLGIYDDSLVFDRTVFYPEGGGQPSDLGFVKFDDLNIPIRYANKVDNIVLHEVDFENFKLSSNELNELLKDKVDKTFEMEINEERRKALARNHSATHLVIAAARKILGDHIWQSGAQKGVSRSRIDLAHYKRISQNEINEIETLANKYVMENIQLDINFMNRTDAERKYGFILYQGGIVPGSTIRVINIPKIDVQACAGTHVAKTGDIGLIKINRTERVQDGVERIDFSAGEAAVNSMQTNDSYLKESSDIFKVTNEQLPKTCERFFSEWKSYRNEIDKLKSEISHLKLSSLSNDLKTIEILKDDSKISLSLVSNVLDSDMSELKNIATDFTDNDKADIAIFGNNNGNLVGTLSKKALGADLKINMIIKDAAKILGGGGGGRPNLAQGAGPNVDKIQEAIDFAIDSL